MKPPLIADMLRVRAQLVHAVNGVLTLLAPDPRGAAPDPFTLAEARGLSKAHLAQARRALDTFERAMLGEQR